MQTPELFHFLFDMVDRDPVLAAGVAIGIVVVVSLLVGATVRRIHPVVIWAALTAWFYGFSQAFPENRNQKLTLVICAVVGSAVMTAWWSWRVAPFIREKLGLPNRPPALLKGTGAEDCSSPPTSRHRPPR